MTDDASSKWVQKLMDKERKLGSARRCLQDSMQRINQSSLQTSIPPPVFCTAKDVTWQIPKFLSLYLYVMNSTLSQVESVFSEDLRE
jgi:hypothetical protein